MALIIPRRELPIADERGARILPRNVRVEVLDEVAERWAAAGLCDLAPAEKPAHDVVEKADKAAPKNKAVKAAKNKAQ